MRRADRHPCFYCRLAAVVVLAHLLAMLALEASPRLHHWVHPDADDDDHDCAAVLFMHGGCDQTLLPVILPARVTSWQEVFPVERAPVWVAEIFIINGTLEHAPPRARRA